MGGNLAAVYTCAHRFSAPPMRLRHVLAALVAALAPLPSAHAQWMPAGPTNAAPSVFARSASAVFAADLSNRTIHRSTDDGRTWQKQPDDHRRRLAPALTGLAAHAGAVGAL